LVKFWWNFSPDTPLNLSAIGVSLTDDGIVIDGITLPDGETKNVTFYSSKDKAQVCIKDEEGASLSVSGDCSNGVKVACDEAEHSGYTCEKVEHNESEVQYIVTGLKHSAVIPYSYSAPSGGGGGGSSYTCDYDWNCTEWSECTEEGIQTRECVNVGTCSDAYNPPATEQECNYTAPEEEEEQPEETTTEEEPTTQETTPPPEEETTIGQEEPTGEMVTGEEEPTGGSPITGRAVSEGEEGEFTGGDIWTTIGIILLVLVVGFLVIVAFKKKKSKRRKV
jgi:hypothetical protein